MRVAVIGAGNIGAAISRAAVSAGHAVNVTAADPDHAAATAATTGAVAASNVEAVRGADIVVLAVPGRVVNAVAGEIANAVGGGVVVDATNPLNATGNDLDIAGVSGAADLQTKLPHSKIVKAFNTVFAASYAQPGDDPEPLDLYIAGDDAAAKVKVAELGSSMGFKPLDVGDLRMARSLEELAFLNITMNAANGWSWQSAWKLVGPETSAADSRESTARAVLNVNQFYKYPMNRVVAIFEDLGQVRSALPQLEQAGFDPSGMNVLSGPEGARLLNLKGAGLGFWARALRVLQRGGAFEGETLRVHDAALKNGQAIIFVPVRNNDEEHRAAGILHRCGGRSIFRYHRWTIDPLPGIQLSESE